MATPIPFPVDIALLESHFVLKMKSEPWTSVQIALQRLGSLRGDSLPYPEMEGDRDAILTYSDILTRSSDSIAFAICLAVHLARLSSAKTPSERFAEALRALSEGLELAALDETGVRDELRRCFNALLAVSSAQAAVQQASKATTDEEQAVAIPLLPAKPSPEDVSTWKANLEKALEAVRRLARPDGIEAERKTWLQWQERLLAHTSMLPEILPDLEFLVCRVVKSLAGTALPASPKRLTLTQWSQALCSVIAADSPYPLWLFLGLLAGLGFDIRDLDESVKNAQTGPEGLRAAQHFLSRIKPGQSKKGLMVLRLSVDSVTSSWFQTPSVPVLTLTFEDFRRPTRVDIMTYLVPRLHGVLIEVDSSEGLDDVVKRVSSDAIQSILPGVRTALLLRTPRTPLPTPPKGFLLTAATSPLEASRVFASTGSSG